MESTYGTAPGPEDWAPDPPALTEVPSPAAVPADAPAAETPDALTQAGAVLLAMSAAAFAGGWYMAGMGFGVFGGVPAFALSLLTAALVASLGAATNGVLAWRADRRRAAMFIAGGAILVALLDAAALWL